MRLARNVVAWSLIASGCLYFSGCSGHRSPGEHSAATCEADWSAPARAQASAQLVVDAERRCHAGEGGFCADLAAWLASAIRCAESGSQAAEDFLRRACDAESGEACYALAERIASLSGLPASSATSSALRANLSRAFPFYKRACDLGQSAGCAYEGWLLATGIANIPDQQRGARLLVETCQLAREPNPWVPGRQPACLFLASCYNEGYGVPRDRTSGRKLRHEVCHEDASACDALFLVPEPSLRVGLWVMEGVLIGLANARAFTSTLLLRSRKRMAGPRSRWDRPLMMLACCAGLLVGAEFAYYFWGSPLQTWAWLLVAFPLMLLPIVVVRRSPPAPG
jgi:hypothetical protein